MLPVSVEPSRILTSLPDYPARRRNAFRRRCVPDGTIHTALDRGTLPAGATFYMMTTGAKPMIRKLSSGQYRLYSRKIDPRTGKRRNLGTFKSRAAAEKHERAVQYFKRH